MGTTATEMNTTTRLLYDCFWALELSEQDRYDGGELTGRLRKRLRERGVRIRYAARTPRGSDRVIHATEDQRNTLCGRGAVPIEATAFNPDSPYACKRCLGVVEREDQ